MKRIAALTLALVLVLGFAACGKTAAEPVQQTPQSAPGEAPAAQEPQEVPVIDVAKEDGVTMETHPWYIGDYYIYKQNNNENATQKKTPEGTIVYGSVSNIVAADPNAVQETYIFDHQVYDCLIDRDLTGEGEYVPGLATEWGYDSDGAFLITLREGVKFHDGTTLDAEDVIFTFHRIADSGKNKCNATMRAIDYDKTEIIDDLHLKIVFTEPVGSLEKDLASGFCGIMSKEFFDNKPDSTLLDEDAGSGPYKLVESVTTVSQTLKRFDEYWGGTPEVETVICKLYRDASVMAVDFINGDLDLCFSNNYDTVQRFLSGEITDTTMYQLYNRSIVASISTRGDVALSDVRLRQALAYCIDYDSLAIGVYQNEVMGAAGTSFFVPGMDGVEEMGKIPYDPELSKSLLAECGYSKDNPCPLKLLVTTSANNKANAEIIQEYGKQVGFDIQIDAVESTAAIEISSDVAVPAAYDIYIAATGYDTGSPSSYLTKHQMYSKPEMQSGMFGIEDETFNALTKEAAHCTDAARRAEIFMELQELYYENFWAIHLNYNYSMTLVHNYVGEFNFASGSHPDYKTLTTANW